MPISKKKHIQQLAYILGEQGVKDIVVCPGSRNMPIVETLASLNYNIHRAIDERSAGFMAVGLAAKTGRATAVCVTSGSAVANLLPSALEAKYQRVPVVFITADRPKEWIDQLDGQTIDQRATLRGATKYCADITDDESEDGNWYANREINSAILCAKMKQAPVQINIQIKEPFFECEEMELQKVRVIRGIDKEGIYKLLAKAERPMLLVGQMSPCEDEEYGYIYGAPYYAEILSNIKNIDKRYAMTEDAVEMYAPDCVVYFGGHIVSKRIKKTLRERPPKVFVRIESEARVQDTFKCMTHLYVGSKKVLYDKLDINEFPFAPQLENRSSASGYHRIYQDFIDYALNNKKNEKINLCIANSTAIRALLHPQADNKRIDVYCNRGVNGIEGSLSAAVGVALADEDITTYLVIGDLSFFYDCNALWSAELPKNLRVLMVNDGKGGIFTRLAMKQTENVRRYVEAEHNTTAEELCNGFGVYYMHITSGYATESEWEIFTSRGIGKAIVMEVDARME